MGASQERAAFFNATLLVVTRHRECIPAGRQADGKFTVSSRFAFHYSQTIKSGVDYNKEYFKLLFGLYV
jgi:hypothetical protein